LGSEIRQVCSLKGPRRWWALVIALLPAACGSIEPGKTSLSQWQRIPDPVTFGHQIHPLLTASCAAAECHSRKTSFTLHPTTDTIPADANISSPLNLPAPFRDDYYTTLGFCDLDQPAASPLLVWGTGAEPAHPGKDALGATDAETIRSWLSSGSP
jgi:hypothetical protein